MLLCSSIAVYDGDLVIAMAFIMTSISLILFSLELLLLLMSLFAAAASAAVAVAAVLLCRWCSCSCWLIVACVLVHVLTVFFPVHVAVTAAALCGITWLNALAASLRKQADPILLATGDERRGSEFC